MISIMFYCAILGVFILLAILIATIRFLPYASYGILSIFTLFVLHWFEFVEKPRFIPWIIITVILCVIHTAGVMNERLRLPFNLLASCGIGLVLSFIMYCSPLNENNIMCNVIYILYVIGSTVFISIYSKVKYIDDTNIFIHILSYPIYGLSIAIHSLILPASSFMEFEKFSFLYIYTIIIGFVVGLIVGFIANAIYTKKVKANLAQYEANARIRENNTRIIHGMMHDLERKLNVCSNLDTLTLVQANIIANNIQMYNDIKNTFLSYHDAKTNERFQQILDSTNEIYNIAIMKSRGEEYSQTRNSKKAENNNESSSRKDTERTTEDSLKDALTLFMFDKLDSVTLESLKSQRNRLIKSFHPDETQDNNSQYMQKINCAYDVIKKAILAQTSR